MTLSGIRVLELAATPAAAYCGRILADHGADVIKIEPPGGDPTRHIWPFIDDDQGPDGSGAHLFLNANKRSVCLDLDLPEHQAALQELVASADALVQDLPVGYLEERSLGYDALSRRNPALVMTSVSPFGQEGPHSHLHATDLTVEAMGGWLFGVGDPDKPPLRPPGHQPSVLGGLWAAISIVSLLSDPQRSPQGEHIDISLQEAVILFQMNTTTTYEYSGGLAPRKGGSSAVNSPQGIYPCKDGLVGINVLYYVEWDRFCDFLDQPQWHDDPRLATPLLRAENRSVIEEVLRPWLMERTSQEIYDAGQAAKLPFAMVNSPLDLLASKQLTARQFWTSYDHPEHGSVTVPGRLFQMTRTGWDIRLPAPTAGEHTAALLGNGAGTSTEVRR